MLSKPFSQCSVEEMRRALQNKRKPGSSKPMPPGSVERGEQYHLAVKAQGAPAGEAAAPGVSRGPE